MIKVDQRKVKQVLEKALDHPVTSEIARKVALGIQDMLNAVEVKLSGNPVMTEQEFKDRMTSLNASQLEEQVRLYE